MFAHHHTRIVPLIFQDKQGSLYGIFTIDLPVFRCEVLLRRLAASGAVRALRGWVGRVAQSVWSRCSCESQGARLRLPETLQVLIALPCLPGRAGDAPERSVPPYRKVIIVREEMCKGES